MARLTHGVFAVRGPFLWLGYSGTPGYFLWNGVDSEFMGIGELFLIGVSLSMDAFAVSVCKGLSMKKIHRKGAFITALYFGGFQALMPLVGWALGKQFERYIVAVDHWIAFLLLAFIGVNMIREAFSEEEQACPASYRLDHRELFMLAIATSIDALTVGITFAFLQVEILPAISLIGCTTFVLSLVGVVMGHRFGSRYQQRAAVAGGVILIAIGLKILLEHLGVLAL